MEQITEKDKDTTEKDKDTTDNKDTNDKKSSMLKRNSSVTSVKTQEMKGLEQKEMELEKSKQAGVEGYGNFFGIFSDIFSGENPSKDSSNKNKDEIKPTSSTDITTTNNKLKIVKAEMTKENLEIYFRHKILFGFDEPLTLAEIDLLLEKLECNPENNVVKVEQFKTWYNQDNGENLKRELAPKKVFASILEENLRAEVRYNYDP